MIFIIIFKNPWYFQVFQVYSHYSRFSRSSGNPVCCTQCCLKVRDDFVTSPMLSLRSGWPYAISKVRDDMQTMRTTSGWHLDDQKDGEWWEQSADDVWMTYFVPSQLLQDFTLLVSSGCHLHIVHMLSLWDFIPPPQKFPFKRADSSAKMAPVTKLWKEEVQIKW